MTIIGWFNPRDPAHIAAYQHLMQTGIWPPGFLPQDLERPPSWQIAIIDKLATCYIDDRTRGHWQKEIPERDGLYWLADYNGNVTGPGLVIRHNGKLVLAGGLRVSDEFGGVGEWAGWYWSEPIEAPPSPGPWEK